MPSGRSASASNSCSVPSANSCHTTPRPWIETTAARLSGENSTTVRAAILPGHCRGGPFDTSE